MQARVMDQKKTRVVLFFVAIAAVGGAVLAGFLFSQNSGATPETQTDQSIQVESDQSIQVESDNEESPTPEEPASDAIEWVEGMTWLDLLTEEELKSLLNAGSEQDAENNGNRGSVAPSPRSSSGNNNYGEGLPTVDDYPSAGDSSSTTAPDCYGQYEEACKVGFVAPTVEYAGYLSCQKLEDGTVALKGLVKLVGGNYKGFSWTGQTHNGMGIVANRVSEWPYIISWTNASATFWSMDDRYKGIIGEAGGHGSVLIDDSQIDPSCRF
jgi:hypothetical protein